MPGLLLLSMELQLPCYLLLVYVADENFYNQQTDI